MKANKAIKVNALNARDLWQTLSFITQTIK